MNIVFTILLQLGFFRSHQCDISRLPRRSKAETLARGRIILGTPRILTRENLTSELSTGATGIARMQRTTSTNQNGVPCHQGIRQDKAAASADAAPLRSFCGLSIYIHGMSNCVSLSSGRSATQLRTASMDRNLHLAISNTARGEADSGSSGICSRGSLAALLTIENGF